MCFFLHVCLNTAIRGIWSSLSCEKNAIFFLCTYTVSVQYTKVAEVCVLIDNIGKDYFLTGHSEKGYKFQNVERTV